MFFGLTPAAGQPAKTLLLSSWQLILPQQRVRGITHENVETRISHTSTCCLWHIPFRITLWWIVCQGNSCLNHHVTEWLAVYVWHPLVTIYNLVFLLCSLKIDISGFSLLHLSNVSGASMEKVQASPLTILGHWCHSGNVAFAHPAQVRSTAFLRLGREKLQL